MVGPVARLERTSPRRVAMALFALALAAFLLVAAKSTLTQHTAYNHYALLAEGFLHGRTDLDGPPPDYTRNNDFAVYDGKHWVSFPPAPALLVAPLVAVSGSADATRDGLFFIVLAALAPALVFLALERVRAFGLSRRMRTENAFLALTFTFGTVYWFTAVQGTVWFAGHVVGTLAIVGYLWASVGADRPALAGLCLGVAVATRPSLAFAVPLFGLELLRTSHGSSPARTAERVARFVTPLAAIGVALAIYNRARFGDPLEFGHHYLQVVWRERMDRWGLFSFHYLGRNLGVALASTPFVDGPVPFRITGHGLALWITSPFFVWALAPRAMPTGPRAFHRALALTCAAVALVDLAYQNTGWVQFGYRFSNDWAPFVIVMIAVGRRRLDGFFAGAVAIAVAVNAFGAVSFARPAYARYYARTPVETIFEPDLAPPQPDGVRWRPP